jgi:hypothetical protein
LGLVGGEAKGELRGNAVCGEMTAGLEGSQKLPEKDEFLDIFSDGGVDTGKQVPQDMGDSWVQSTVVGP